MVFVFSYCEFSFLQFLREFNFSAGFSPATSSLGALQLSGKELGNGGEAVAHAEDVSALRAQDGGEGVSDALDLQQKNMVK